MYSHQASSPVCNAPHCRAFGPGISLAAKACAPAGEPAGDLVGLDDRAGADEHGLPAPGRVDEQAVQLAQLGVAVEVDAHLVVHADAGAVRRHREHAQAVLLVELLRLGRRSALCAAAAASAQLARLLLAADTAGASRHSRPQPTRKPT